jgi:hypothetical protein
MASPDFTATPAIRPAAPKARMTIYFALLIISFVALLFGCLFMYLELRNYWNDNQGRPIRKTAAAEPPARVLLAVLR